MDKSWMMKNRMSREYDLGVERFIQFGLSHVKGVIIQLDFHVWIALIVYLRMSQQFCIICMPMELIKVRRYGYDMVKIWTQRMLPT